VRCKMAVVKRRAMVWMAVWRSSLLLFCAGVLEEEVVEEVRRRLWIHCVVLRNFFSLVDGDNEGGLLEGEEEDDGEEDEKEEEEEETSVQMDVVRNFMSSSRLAISGVREGSVLRTTGEEKRVGEGRRGEVRCSGWSDGMVASGLSGWRKGVVSRVRAIWKSVLIATYVD